MNLPKAIEILQQDLDEPDSVDFRDREPAQALGIEALKWRNHLEENAPTFHYKPLPGQTKD